MQIAAEKIFLAKEPQRLITVLASFLLKHCYFPIAILRSIREQRSILKVFNHQVKPKAHSVLEGFPLFYDFATTITQRGMFRNGSFKIIE